jgi:hypothetical protein
MKKYKVILETYVEAEDVLRAAFTANHKLDSLGDVQFQFEIVDVVEVEKVNG